VFEDEDSNPLPRGQTEFERAMADAVSSGTDVWITTKAGETFTGQLQSVSVNATGVNGREITVRINDRKLVYQEIQNWTVGLTGEPDDIVLDGAISNTLKLFGPMTVEDLVTDLGTGPSQMWCTAPRARGRLQVLENEQRVKRAEQDGTELWAYARPDATA
jgi:hypothetical protein